MAGAPLPLRPLVLLCVALVVAADVVVYEDLGQDDTPGVETHSWTVMGDGQGGDSNFVMQVETVSTSGGEGSQALFNLFGDGFQGTGFGDAAIADDAGYAGGDSYAWANQQFISFQDFPFFVSSYPQAFSQRPQDSQGQMLQNVACARFEPALTDMRSQGGNSMVWGYGADADVDPKDQGWDIEVFFMPYDAEAEDADQDSIDGEQQTAQWFYSGEGQTSTSWSETKEEDTASPAGTEHWLNGCLFSMLVFSCFLTLFFCMKQCCELRRAMKETAHKAREIAFYEEVEEKQSLLQKKGFEQDDDGYTDVIIAPISEPALKAVYP